LVGVVGGTAEANAFSRPGLPVEWQDRKGSMADFYG
jgi:hypothetical protein